MIYLIFTALVFLHIVYKYYIHCKIVGHKFKNEVLWKKCRCCGKTKYLHMASGKYI